MSSEQRTIERLPLHIFTNLSYDYRDDSDSHCQMISNGGSGTDGDGGNINMNDQDDHVPLTPYELRAGICKKLKDIGRKARTMNGIGGMNIGSDMSKGSNSNSSLGDGGNRKNYQDYYHHQQQRQHQGISTVGQILRMTPPALLRALDPILTNDECHELIRRICKACSPKSVTAKQLLSSQSSTLSSSSSPSSSSWPLPSPFLPSDIPKLDTNLRGGFPIGSITEIVGMAGVGKTQLAMQLCVVAARYGVGSIFIDTEKKLSLERMKDIAVNRENLAKVGGRRMTQGRGHNTAQGDDYYKPLSVVLDNITVHKPSNTAALDLVVSRLDEEILLRNEQAGDQERNTMGRLRFPVKLVVVDSIAATARRDFGGGRGNGNSHSGSDAPQRVKAMLRIAQMLKRIADQMHVAIVVINQIEKVDERSESVQVSPITAALGTSWHHCVSTRVALEYGKESVTDDHTKDFRLQFYSTHIEEQRTRTATIVKSHMVGRSKISFEVTKSGICEIDRM